MRPTEVEREAERSAVCVRRRGPVRNRPQVENRPTARCALANRMSSSPHCRCALHVSTRVHRRVLCDLRLSVRALGDSAPERAGAAKSHSGMGAAHVGVRSSGRVPHRIRSHHDSGLCARCARISRGCVQRVAAQARRRSHGSDLPAEIAWPHVSRCKDPLEHLLIGLERRCNAQSHLFGNSGPDETRQRALPHCRPLRFEGEVEVAAVADVAGHAERGGIVDFRDKAGRFETGEDVGAGMMPLLHHEI